MPWHDGHQTWDGVTTYVFNLATAAKLGRIICFGLGVCDLGEMRVKSYCIAIIKA